MKNKKCYNNKDQYRKLIAVIFDGLYLYRKLQM